MKQMDISCPISSERVNENVVRLVAGMVLLIALACIFTGNYYAMIFLVFDFGIRAFTGGGLSVLKLFAQQLVKGFDMGIKPTDLAPKKFAAGLGFVFCLTISTTYLLGFHEATSILALVLCVFATLESVFAVCVGCHVYSILTKLFPNK